MRACLMMSTGGAVWTDDDSEEPLQTIHVDGLYGLDTKFTYVGLVKTKNHVYRKYQEIVTEGNQ